jgi:hypothetical protein
MRRMLKLIAMLLGLAWALQAQAGSQYAFEPGDTVLANCRQIYTKGVVKTKVDDGYTLHFDKGSGPLNCPPFRWHNEFVLPFQSVPEYRLKFLGGFKRDLVFKVGEDVEFRFEADKRMVKNKDVVDIQARITDISANGAIAVKLLSSDPESAAMFWKMVGGNYVDVRHESLAQEREKRSR